MRSRSPFGNSPSFASSSRYSSSSRSPSPSPGYSSYRPTTPQLLQGRPLRQADYGVVHPDLSGIRTRRDSWQSGHEFADFTSDARASTGALMSQPHGRRMLTELNGRTEALNPGRVGTPTHPLTVADIHSGRRAEIPNSHRPRYGDTLGSLQAGYRYDGVPGAGQASRIQYDDRFDERHPGMRFNSLGHESVHAWRTAHGIGVSPLEVSPRRNDPFLGTQPPVLGQMIGHHAHLREEFETVGIVPTPHRPNGWAPNENMIRREHGLPSRNDYSGETPARIDDMLRPADEATDDRSWYTRTFTNQPSPVGSLVGYLER